MPSGLRDGDEFAVVVYLNKFNIGEITGEAVSNNELTALIFAEDQKMFLLLYEVMSACFEAAKFHMQKPHLKKMLEDRIAQLKADQDDSEAGESPYPTVHDIPS